MRLADNLERELPYMRRYARAVTGSGERGDALVEAALVSFMDDVPPATGRLEIFTRLEQTIRASGVATAGTDTASLPRRALLLTAMEGFAPGDAALIMGCADEEISQLITDAENDLTASLAADVFIIEDEPIVAVHIEQIARSLGHNVVGHATTCEQAVEACRALKPSLLLVDIQLADGSSGAEAANIITRELDIPVVFITAFSERLLTGRIGEPIYLIAKPFRPDMLKAVMSQALIQSAADQPSENYPAS